MLAYELAEHGGHHRERRLRLPQVVNLVHFEVAEPFRVVVSMTPPCETLESEYSLFLHPEHPKQVFKSKRRAIYL